MLGPSAARRAARRRRLGALEAWCHAAAGPCKPGSWQDRERAARPALVSAVEGLRVAGASRQRRNAALHAARAPPSGFLKASAEEIAKATQGPRLGFQLEAEDAVRGAVCDVGCLADKAVVSESEQRQWALAPLSMDWEAKPEPDVRCGSKWLEDGGKVIHVAELESKLRNLADSLSRAPWRRRGRGREHEDEPNQTTSMGGDGVGGVDVLLEALGVTTRGRRARSTHPSGA